MYNSSSLKTLSVIFIFFIFSSSVLSQTQKEPKFGKISLEQLQKTVDEKFPDAHAVVLFDYGDSYYRFVPHSGLQLTTERHVAIQFFDNTKFDLATFEVSLLNYKGNKEKLENVKGYTYNLTDGKFDRVKFSRKDIITEEIDEGTEVKKFTMPNLKEGSIIEVRYNISSDFYSKMDPWYFQDQVPTRYSEFNIEIPEFFTFNKNMVGFYAPFIKKSKEKTMGGYRVFTQGWVMKDLPAFEIEDHMRSFRNYVSKIDFELKSIEVPHGPIQNYTKSWDKIGKNLMKHNRFGMDIKKGRGTKEIVSKFEGSNSMENMVAIYEYVKTNMKWDGRSRLYSNKGISKALKEGKGNSADINLALIATLKKAGYNVKPIVLSTRNNGMIPMTHPSRNSLNYVIAVVELEEKTIYLDATDDYFPAGILPYRCFNGNAILLGKEKPQLVNNLKPKAKYKSVIQNKLTLSADGILEGTVKKTKAGYDAIKFRKVFDRADNEDAFIESLQNKQEGLTIESHKIENLKDPYKSIKEEYQVTLDDKVEMAGDLIYLNPMINDAYDENPFKMKQRQYPVDYAIPIEETYMLQFTIPEGYTIESLPEGVTLGLPEKATLFSYSAKQMGDKINVISRVKISKTLFVGTEYDALKNFYNLIIKKHMEQIVLKKL